MADIVNEIEDITDNVKSSDDTIHTRLLWEDDDLLITILGENVDKLDCTLNELFIYSMYRPMKVATVLCTHLFEYLKTVPSQVSMMMKKQEVVKSE